MECLTNHENKEDCIQVLSKLDVTSVINKIVYSGFQNDSFYICDVSDLIRKYQFWKEIMPRITTYYAVKCNDSRVVLETLASLGIGFDCASKEEIKKVLLFNVDPRNIIYANPTKDRNYIKYAATVGVCLMTFDNEYELYKIKEVHPTAKLVIRIKYDDVSAGYVLGGKYGCDPEKEAVDLLRTAFSLNLNVVGVAFHVGSNCKNYLVYEKAVAVTRYVFDEASKVGYKFNLVDIGGGFPGEINSSIKEIGEIINAAIDKYFPDPAITIIAEPGRYYVNSAFTLVSRIHSMKTVRTDSDKESYAYYVDISIYGTLIGVLCTDEYTIKPLNSKPNEKLYPTVVWGATCDPLDRIAKDVMLPKMSIGDWIVIENAGGYTLSLASEFNGIPAPQVHSVVDKQDWLYLTEKNPFPMRNSRFVIGNAEENYRIGLTGPSKFRTNYF